MNKTTYILPLVLTIGFIGLYYNYTVGAKKERVQTKIVAEAAAQETLLKKQEAERMAKADSDKRIAERLAEEKKKEADKLAKWEAASKAIADDTASYLAQTAKSENEFKALTARLAAVRVEKDLATQARFDFDLEIEKPLIAKRTSELEIQRLVEMIARKGGTTLGNMATIP